MPKIFGKEIHPVLLIGGVVVAIYLGMGAMQPAATPTVTKKQAVKTSSVNLDPDIIPADYTAHFASLTGTPGDAFRPLVSRAIGGGQTNQGIDNFTYSGMAQLNGVSSGLLENSTTGEGDFVQVGEHWHNQWMVVSITPDQISLKDDVGEIKNLVTGTTEGKGGSSGVNVNTQAANAPFNPAMVGAIGNGADISVQADDPSLGVNLNMGGNNRQRGRGNRGGGRGGRGGGGGGGQGGN